MQSNIKKTFQYTQFLDWSLKILVSFYGTGLADDFFFYYFWKRIRRGYSLITVIWEIVWRERLGVAAIWMEWTTGRIYKRPLNRPEIQEDALVPIFLPSIYTVKKGRPTIMRKRRQQQRRRRRRHHHHHRKYALQSDREDREKEERAVNFLLLLPAGWCCGIRENRENGKVRIAPIHTYILYRGA